jgi:hypothetical protein
MYDPIAVAVMFVVSHPGFVAGAGVVVGFLALVGFVNVVSFVAEAIRHQPQNDFEKLS